VPTVPASKITDDLIAKVAAMIRSVSAEDVTRVEAEVSAQHGIPVGTQRRYKLELRRLFNLAPRSPLIALSSHPQLQQALEYILTRKERSDSGMLRGAAGMSVTVPATGEMLSVEEFLKALYTRENSNAMKCYLALRARCVKKQIVGRESLPVNIEDLPSETSVIRFLGNIRKVNAAVRRGRSRRHDWEVNQQPFVTRDTTQYRPGELWIGDHTELDVVVTNDQGKLDHRWVTAFIDMRTRLIPGYHLNWMPNSQTIALAFRNGVLARQLKAYNGEKYIPLNINSLPEEILIDNGKDYRSTYTQRVFGKIDFSDDARRSIQRLSKLHYAIPYHGQSKAEMERWFRTITYSVLNCLPGYKGNKYQNQPDSLKEEIKQGRIMNYEDFDALFAVAVNAYNNKIHRSLNGQSPLQVYLTNTTTQRSIEPRVLDFLMMKVSNRTIRRCQVTLLGNEYYSDSLMPFNDRKADVYYDPMDVGFISIYVGGEFAAIACNKEMIGQDERGWLRILHDRKKNERTLQEEVKDLHKGISNAQAKQLLLEGELLNITPVSRELLQCKTTAVTLLTGLERQAREQDEKLKDQEQAVEIEKRAKKRAKQMEITADMISRIS
jgi:transposase InsO family protein